MAGRKEKLRQGKSVEVNPGIYAKLNFEDKTLEYSDGRKLPISEKNKRDLFPANEKALKYAKTKEHHEKKIKETPGGEFFHKLGQHGIIGGATDIKDWLVNSGDEYLRLKRAKNEIGEEISERSPLTSAAAFGASFVPDLALTQGLSAAKAAPILTAASSGSELFTNPGEVAAKSALAAGGGWLVDKGASFLNQAAARRGASRGLPAQIEGVKAQNIAGNAANKEFNLNAQRAFNTEKQNVANQNSALLHQHKLQVNDLENKMIAAKQQAGELSNEYKMAQKQYHESLKNIPALQKEAQAEFSKNVVKNSKAIEKAFPPKSKILLDDIEAKAFIDQSINKTGLAASKEGNKAAKIIKTLFPEGETLSGSQLSQRYHAIEEAIQRAEPEVQQVLSQFKNHLGEKLPLLIENSIAYEKITPYLIKGIRKDVDSVFKSMKGINPKIQQKIRNNLSNLSQEISGKDFLNNLTSGNFKSDILEKIAPVNYFIPNADKLTPEATKKLLAMNPEIYSADRKIREKFLNELSKKIDSSLSKYELSASKSISKIPDISKNIKATQGLSEPVLPPNPPEAPILPNQNLPMPSKPSLYGQPSSPIAQPFLPQPTPSLPAASGVAENTGDFLEKKLLGGKGIVNNPLAKLAGLKYALGPAALPAEAAYLGLKGLTSPTAGGELARQSFQQGGIKLIEEMAQRYPSYHDGILEDPRDRRSLNREVEDRYDIPIEQKAIIQSKINRGRPLEQML